MSQFTTPAKLEMLDHYKWRLVEPFVYYTNVTPKYACIHVLATQGIPCGACPTPCTMQIDDPNLPFFEAHIQIPAGYVTDLTTVPRLLWSVFPPHGRYAKAAIVHDYLYSNALGTKSWADAVFFEAMTVLGVPRWRRTVMYWAVRLFGKGKYASWAM